MRLNMPYRRTKENVENFIAISTILWYVAMTGTFVMVVFNHTPGTLVGIFLSWVFLDSCTKWKNLAATKGWYE